MGLNNHNFGHFENMYVCNDYQSCRSGTKHSPGWQAGDP